MTRRQARPGPTRTDKPGTRVSGYSAAALVRQGLRSTPGWERAWGSHDLRDRYEVVIIGGGLHGLATAYYLASRHGITDVAVLDKGYLGGGGSGRNTAIARSNPRGRRLLRPLPEPV
jgi:sarcosine oxidase, subunit beta